MLRKQLKDFSEIVHIRGLVRPVEDVNDMQAVIAASAGNLQTRLDTAMWNPMHFAVYRGHLEVLKALGTEFDVNIGRSAPRSPAKHEGDAVNDQGDDRYLEDTVYLLQVALVKRHVGCLAWLLDRYSCYWPKSLFEDWFKPLLLE